MVVVKSTTPALARRSSSLHATATAVNSEPNLHYSGQGSWRDPHSPTITSQHQDDTAAMPLSVASSHANSHYSGIGSWRDPYSNPAGVSQHRESAAFVPPPVAPSHVNSHYSGIGSWRDPNSNPMGTSQHKETATIVPPSVASTHTNSHYSGIGSWRDPHANPTGTSQQSRQMSTTTFNSPKTRIQTFNSPNGPSTVVRIEQRTINSCNASANKPGDTNPSIEALLQGRHFATSRKVRFQTALGISPTEHRHRHTCKH
jgi:hypothetical protein